MPDPNERNQNPTQEQMDATREEELQADQVEQEKVLEQEVAADDNLGFGFEASGSSEPPPGPVKTKPGGHHLEPSDKDIKEPSGPTMEDLEKKIQAQQERMNNSKEQQQKAQDHGLGPQPQQPGPTPAEMEIIQRIRQGDAQMQQAMIDDIFKVINKYQPPNVSIIGILELIQDEYVRLSKKGPNQPPKGNIAVPGGAPTPGGIVTPGGPPR